MSSTTMLVVSNPPHGSVKEEAAAAALGLSLDEARLKIRFGAPEVLAASHPTRAADLAIALKAAGIHVEMREAHALAEVPWPTLVSTFDFRSTGLLARSGSQAFEIGYDEPVFGVYCEPPADFRPPEGAPDPDDGVVRVGPAAAEALEWVSHLDLYFGGNGPRRRIAITGESLVAMVDECKGRFRRLVLDSRLEGVRPRRRFVAGEQGFDPDMRKRYAFGTLLLRHLLEEISPELRDVTQYELGSRLAYVLEIGRRD